MPSKTKLELAVEQAASKLKPAQREIVLSQMREYKANKSRILSITDMLSGMKHSSISSSSVSANAATRVALSNELSELMKANAEISDKLFNQLGGID